MNHWPTFAAICNYVDECDDGHKFSPTTFALSTPSVQSAIYSPIRAAGPDLPS